MRIAVWASHAPESIWNVVRLAAILANGQYCIVRQNMSEFFQIGPIFDTDGRGVRADPSSGGPTPMEVDKVGKGKGKGCFVLDTRQWTASSIEANAKVKGQARAMARRQTRRVRSSSRASAVGHKWAEPEGTGSGER